MSLSKIVTGSLVGAALAWSAGANANSEDFDYGRADGEAWGYAQINLWCSALEGNPGFEGWSTCHRNNAYYAFLDLMNPLDWVSGHGFEYCFFHEESCDTQDYRDGLEFAAWEFFSMSGCGGS